MLTTSLIAVLSSLLLVNAQNPQIEVASINQQFDNAYIVPDLIAAFDPLAYLTVDYNGNPVIPGTLLAVADTQTQPTITITPANSSVSLGSLFTLAMVDPGAVGKVSATGPTRHWLVNGVTIGANGALSIPASTSAITPYGAPYPDAADPPHRYTILLWQQPASFAPTGDLATPGQPVTQFDLKGYVSSSGLGPVVAGWYFTCTRGTAVAATTTSSVDSATLTGAPAGTGSGAGSSTRASSSTATTTTRGGAASSFAVTPLTVLGSIAATLFGIVVA